MKLTRLLLSSLLALASIFPTLVWAECLPQEAGVLMATPLSSRLDRVGDTVQGVLEHPFTWGTGVTFPSGTLLRGRITAVKQGEPTGGKPGALQFKMTQASNAAFGVQAISAMPITEGGWLRQQDANTTVWQVTLSHSTRLLNVLVQRRLGTNQGVWASSLGIQQNVIPDVTTDEFIEWYHRNNVLVGAGDRVFLRFECP